MTPGVLQSQVKRVYWPLTQSRSPTPRILMTRLAERASHSLLPWVPAGGVCCVAVDLPQHRGNVALPCPHDCGSEIEYTLPIRTRQDGEVFYYQAPPECPGCHRELPMLPDAHFERLTQSSEQSSW